MKPLLDVTPCLSCGSQPNIYSGAEWMEASRATIPHAGIPPDLFIVGCIGPGHSTYSGSYTNLKDAIDCWNKMTK